MNTKRGLASCVGILALALIPALAAATALSAGLSDEFDDAALGRQWTVVSPNPASTISMTGTALQVVAAPWSDYWGGMNFNAPRVLQRVSGDWTIETKLTFSPTSDYQGAGIMLCFEGDPVSSNGCWRIAERAFYPGGGGNVVRSVGGYVGYGSAVVHLRVQKSGRTYTGWYSPDGTSWILNGFEITQTRDIAYAGVFAISSWGAPPSVTELDYFRMTPGATDVASDLVGHYQLDGDGVDSSGLDNHGTSQGAVATADRFSVSSRAMSFDEDYIEVPDSPSLRLANATLAGWFRFDRVPSDLRTLVEKAARSDAPDAYAVWWEGGNLYGHVSDTAVDGPPIGYGFTPVPGTWYHIAYTFDDARNLQVLYLNGTAVQMGWTSQSMGHDAFPLLIGADTEGGIVTFRFPGAIDDVRVYDRALSGADILKLTAVGYTVTATKTGAGNGSVSSSSPGIDCGTTCAADFPYLSPVRLTAIPDASSVFLGWGGACTDRGRCTFTVNDPTAVSAVFAPRTKPDAVADFSIAQKPNGEWRYGWTASLGASLHEYDTTNGDPQPGFDQWHDSSGTAPTVGRNETSAPLTYGGTMTVPVDVLHMHPGPAGQYSVVRWTAPADGRYRATFSFEGLQSCCGGTTSGAAVLKDSDGGAPLFTADIAGWGASSRVTAERSVTLATGGVIDFVVGWGSNDDYTADSTGLSATIDRLATLTVSPAGTGAGSVTSIPAGVDCGFDCTEDYLHGTTVTLTATAAAGSTFSHWSDAGSGTASTCDVTMDAAKSVTATFTRNRHALDVTKDGTGGGTVTSDPAGVDCGSDCAQDYDEGTVVTLDASPAAGSVFDGWGGACGGTSATCDVALSAPRSATATFRQVSGYYPVVPCRVFDSRDAALGGPDPLGAQTETPVVMADHCGIPSTAQAVTLNVTVTAPTQNGHLRLFRDGDPLPVVSAVNYAQNQTRANNGAVPIGLSGAVAVYVGQGAGSVHVIIDVSGYFQ